MINSVRGSIDISWIVAMTIHLDFLYQTIFIMSANLAESNGSFYGDLVGQFLPEKWDNKCQI